MGVCIRCNRERILKPNGMCASCYNMMYVDNEKRKQEYIKYRGSSYKNNIIVGKKRIKKPMRIPKTACTILVEHHESMKEDPEHLTTEFIKKLIKVDCKDI